MLTYSKISEEEAIKAGAAVGRILDLSLRELGYVPEGHGEREGIRLASALWRQARGEEGPDASPVLGRLARLRRPQSAEGAAAEVHALRKAMHARAPLEVLGQAALAREALAQGEPLYLGELAALLEVTPAALLYRHKAGKLDLRRRDKDAARVAPVLARGLLAEYGIEVAP